MSLVRRCSVLTSALAIVACGIPAAAAVPAGSVAARSNAVVARAIARTDIVDLGRATASTPVRVAVTLAYRNKAELDRLVELQANPRSPLFRHFLKPAQFAAEFAPAPADYVRVATALQAAGFHVAPMAGNRTIVDAVGPSPAAERFFGTEIHRVGQYGHGIRYANVTPATIPAALATSVVAVAGIDNVVKFRSARMPAGSQISGPLERGSGLYPTAIAKAYHYPVQTGYTGAGRAIGIVIDSDILNSDIWKFWGVAGIHRTGSIVRRLVEGTNPGETGDAAETAIDVEMSSSLAPGADIYIYLMPDLSDQSIEDAYNLTVQDEIVDVVSSSFGGCELDDTPFAEATDAIAEQGEAQGTSYTASTGDAGGFCEDETRKGRVFYENDVVNIPASDPHFTAVGATALKVNASGARTTETTWGPGGSQGGGGGGVSSFWSLPDYQTGIAGMAVVPAVSATPPASQPNTGFAGRNVPDISLDGSNQPGSYVAIYVTAEGGWVGYGGTSVSCPLFAALIAEQNQETNSYAGFENELIYQNFTNGGANANGIYGYGTEFRDIVNGTIGSGWSAAPGFDQATGTGSVMDGNV